MSQINKRILLHLKNNPHLSQKQLADYIGYPAPTISRWLTKERTIPADVIIPICEYLNVTLEWLLTGRTLSSPNNIKEFTYNQDFKTSNLNIKNNMNINEKILLVINNDKKLSQKGLATYIGRTPSTINNWLNLKRSIPSEELVSICEYLHVTLDWLLNNNSTSSMLGRESEELEILDLLYKLPPEEKIKHISFIKGYLTKTILDTIK